jgi:hypothetical protein
MEQRKPHDEEGAGEQAQTWAWTRTSSAGVPLTALLGDLGSWKSDHGRETLPPIPRRRGDLAGTMAGADGLTGLGADRATGPGADGATGLGADGATGLGADGSREGAGDHTTDHAADGTTGADGTAVAGSLLDWLALSSAAAEKAVGEPT